SRSKRSPNWAEETLIATIRSRRVSLARYTSPIPPAPTCVRISYGPRRAPAESDIRNVERFYRTRACGGRASATIGGAGLAHGEHLLSFGFLTCGSAPLRTPSCRDQASRSAEWFRGWCERSPVDSGIVHARL